VLCSTLARVSLSNEHSSSVAPWNPGLGCSKPHRPFWPVAVFRILLFLITLAVNLPLPLLAAQLPWLNLLTNGVQQKQSCRGYLARILGSRWEGRDRGNRRPGGGMGRVSSHSAADGQTQPVGLGRPPYLVIGFMGPVIHSLNMAF